MAAAGAGGDAIFLFYSVIRGHHVYKSVWTPTVGEVLQVSEEPDNLHDINVLKESNHVPREINRIFTFFQAHNGTISCEVIGHRKFGKGLEVPCIYKLTGKEKLIVKARKILESVKN